MKKNIKSMKKLTIVNIIEIISVTFLLIGASYAYFQARIENGKTASVVVNAKKVDLLTFNKGKQINLELNQFNFRSGMENQKDSTEVSAILQASDSEKGAKTTYNIYLIIENNDFEYTTADKEAEIIFRVYNPKNEEVQEIEGLKYVGNGFDITDRTESFLIAKDYAIESKNLTIQDWKVEVEAINLKTNQENNVGKKFNAKVYITTNDYPSYEAPKIVNDEIKATANQIVFTPQIDMGTQKIVKYYYGIEKVAKVSAIMANSTKSLRSINGVMQKSTRSIEDIRFQESTENHFVFTDLEDNTEYKIYCYVEDVEGIKSNIYEIDVITYYEEPKIEKIEYASIDGGKITARIEATEGSKKLRDYYFKVNDGENYERSSTNTYSFEVPETGNIKVEGYVVDSGEHETEHKSIIYENPSISNVDIEKINGTSIKIKITGQKGTSDIKGYYISIDKGVSYQEVLTTNLEAEYTYEEINDKEAFNVQVYVKDEKNRKSNEVVKGISQITINFNGNGNSISSEKESCFILEGQESCTITTPIISKNNNTPEIIGYSESAENHTKVIGSGEEIIVRNEDNGKTYYAQSKNNPITHTITYTKQGNGVTAIGKQNDTCTRVATYNGIAQAPNCTVVAPSISVSTGYTSVGWSTTATSHEGIAVNQNITLTGNATYYSISYKNAITYSVTYNANNNTIAATSGNCTIPAAYNTDNQGTTCTTTTPVITKNEKTPTILGYAQTSGATTAEVGSGASLTLSASNNGKTYYAITRKDEVKRTITYNKGANVSSTGKGSDTCTIGATYNGTTQGTTCNVTLTTITPASGYLVDGFYEGTTRRGNVGASITLSGDVTYTANVGTVSFVLNSASASEMKVTTSVSPASTPLAASAYQYNTSDSWSGINATTSTTNTFSVDATSNYTLYVRVTDAQGIVAVKNVVYTNPSVGTPTVASKSWNSITVSVIATKGTADITKYYFSDDNGGNYNYSTTTNQVSLTGIDPDVSKSIKAYVEDSNGRRSGDSATLTAATDSYTVPSVTIDGTPTVTTSSIKISYTGTDNSGKIKQYRFFLNGSQVATADNAAGTFSYTYSSGIKSGTAYKVKVQAVDTNIKPSTGTEFVSAYSDEKSVTTLKSGWVTESSCKKYYVSGKATTGWKTISSKKYYFKSNGCMQTGWLTSGSNKYYFNSSGVMQTGFKTISSNNYCFSSSGVMLTGWVTVKGDSYCTKSQCRFFSKSDGHWLNYAHCTDNLCSYNTGCGVACPSGAPVCNA